MKRLLIILAVSSLVFSTATLYADMCGQNGELLVQCPNQANSNLSVPPYPRNAMDFNITNRAEDRQCPRIIGRP